MQEYTQISLEEREEIFKGLCEGKSQVSIAASLGRHKSSISREVKRNSDHIGYLYPRQAQERTDKRKAKHGYKVNRIDCLKDYIIAKLQVHWSPIAIAGRWNLERFGKTITHESLYEWIYSKEGRMLGLPKLLPRAKPKRGYGRPKKVKSKIPFRVSISSRPESINRRKELGHLEGDLIFNKGSKTANVLTLLDRKSRYVMLIKNKSKKSEVIIDAILSSAEKHGAASVTFDNGMEFTNHQKIIDRLSIPTYFCDPGAPWQKGSVENMNRLLRRFIPFDLETHDITQEYLNLVADILNNTPRAILGFRTPAEAQKNIDLKNVLNESRVKLAGPAMEAYVYMNFSGVALRC